MGRASILAAIKQRLFELHPHSHAPIAIQGMLGIGKTSLAAMLVHDPQVRQRYADGILWATLGNNPDALAILRRWASLFGLRYTNTAGLLPGISNRLAAHIQDRRMLVVLDDVWDMADLRYLLVGGGRSRSIISTRRLSVANAVVASPDDIFKLLVLDEAQSLQLLTMMAPQINDQRLVDDLVNWLEGLPLTLQIAARLVDMGPDSTERAFYQRILKADMPVSTIDADPRNPMTLHSALEQAIAQLRPAAKRDFVMLGQLPATFDLAALRAIQTYPDIHFTLRELVNSGLLQVVGEGRFHLHALLRAYIRLTNGEE